MFIGGSGKRKGDFEVCTCGLEMKCRVMSFWLAASTFPWLFIGAVYRCCFSVLFIGAVYRCCLSVLFIGGALITRMPWRAVPSVSALAYGDVIVSGQAQSECMWRRPNMVTRYESVYGVESMFS
jgi:hypothetical protein